MFLIATTRRGVITKPPNNDPGDKYHPPKEEKFIPRGEVRPPEQISHFTPVIIPRTSLDEMYYLILYYMNNHS